MAANFNAQLQAHVALTGGPANPAERAAFVASLRRFHANDAWLGRHGTDVATLGRDAARYEAARRSDGGLNAS